MSDGYIKVWRKIQESVIWRHSVAVHVFLDLLLRVSHKTTTTFVSAGADRRVRVDLLPGQCAVRQTLLADDLGRDYKTIKAALDLLVDLKYIDMQQEGHYALITIPNWKKYQEEPNPASGKNGEADGEADGEAEPASGKNGEADGEAGERTQLSSNKKRRKKASPDGDDARFDAWWVTYPRKVGKKGARKAFAAALWEVDYETLMAATRAFADSDKAHGEFCPHPSTWLNQGRWDDDPATWQDRNGHQSAPPLKPLSRELL